MLGVNEDVVYAIEKRAKARFVRRWRRMGLPGIRELNEQASGASEAEAGGGIVWDGRVSGGGWGPARILRVLSRASSVVGEGTEAEGWYGAAGGGCDEE